MLFLGPNCRFRWTSWHDPGVQTRHAVLHILTTFPHYYSLCSKIYDINHPISTIRNSHQSLRATSVLAPQCDSPRRWRAHCISAHVGDQYPSCAPFAEVNPNISTVSPETHDRAIRNSRCSMDRGMRAAGPVARGYTPFWKVSSQRAITQCVTPSSPALATSTPFVRGIREGDHGGLLPTKQAS